MTTFADLFDGASRHPGYWWEVVVLDATGYGVRGWTRLPMDLLRWARCVARWAVRKPW